MGIENRAAQAELRRRTTTFITPSRKELIGGAVRTIVDGMQEIRHRSGEVIYPYVVSSIDEARVRQLVQNKFGGLVFRVGEFTPIRLEEGIGTVISIKEKGRR